MRPSGLVNPGIRRVETPVEYFFDHYNLANQITASYAFKLAMDVFLKCVTLNRHAIKERERVILVSYYITGLSYYAIGDFSS